MLRAPGTERRPGCHRSPGSHRRGEGSAGAQGLTGAQGTTRTRGAAGGGSGVYESSGGVNMAVDGLGLSAQSALLPVDGAVQTAPLAQLSGGMIGGSISPPFNTYVAQVVPNDETVTSMAVSFITTAPLILLSATTVQATVYVSSNGGVSFSPEPGATVLLPPLTGVVPQGLVVHGSVNGINGAVMAGELLMVVFSSSATLGNPNTDIAGVGTAGITFTGS